MLASHAGTDDTEYIELYGTPGTGLYGLSVIVVEGDAFGPGSIDRRFDFKPFHVLGENGFFLIGNCGGLATKYTVTPDASLFTNYLENSSLTVALVETASITGESVSGSEVVLDAIALTDGGAGDTFYFGAPVLGPDGSFFPPGARRVADGVDTDTAADWVLSDFSLGSANTPTGGGFNGCAPIELTIPEIQGIGQWSPYEGEVIITEGVVTLFTANGAHCWIQDPAGDGDSATSDGIFVSGCGYPGEGTVPLLGEVPLTNLIMVEKDAERYTYVYDGNSQVLDHMLVSQGLYELLAAADILHFDAGYPEVLASDATTPLKVSDHDPVEGRFTLGKAPRGK